MVEYVNGGEELMKYTNLIKIFNTRYNDGDMIWKLEKLPSHRKTPYENLEVKVLWDTGEETWETMKIIN